MLKRITAMLLALLLLACCMPAMAAESYTLAEKISLQMNDGSGMKGSFTLSASGEAEWAKRISAIAAGDYQLRAIKSGEGYICELYAAEGEGKQAVTKLYITDGEILLASELLPDMQLSIPRGAGMLEALLGAGQADNPSWYSAALNLLGIEDQVWDTAWEIALAPYYTDIEVWMMSYSAAPAVLEENGQTVMVLRYEIPADAVGKMIASLLSEMLQDQTLKALLAEQLTEEQLQTYFAPELLYHYENILRTLPLEGSIQVERKVTTMGEDLFSAITLPLLPGEDGWQSLRIEDELGGYTLTLTGAERTVSLGVSAETEQNGATERVVTWRNVPAALSEEAKAVSWRMNVQKTYATRTDDDTRSHEETTWAIRVEQDLAHLAEDDANRALYEAVEPIDVQVKLHLSSKNANTSPTTAVIDVAYDAAGESFAFSGEFKTSSPWVAETMGEPTGENVASMTADQLNAVLEMFITNAVEALDGQ